MPLPTQGNLKPATHMADPFRRNEPQCAAAPWESIIEEGFQATLAGTGNGKVHGAGIYFAKDSALAHKYAVHSKRSYEASRPACAREGEQEEPLRMFLSRIVTGVYTGLYGRRGVHAQIQSASCELRPGRTAASVLGLMACARLQLGWLA